MAAGDGLISMKPTSIAHAGTSAVINADGGVDFTSVSSLSLNGVFTSAYDNYLLVFNADYSTSGGAHNFRFRVSGSDNSTANSYVSQMLDVYSTTVAGSRSTSNQGNFAEGISGDQRYGVTAHFYGPALAQPTAWRTIVVGDSGSAAIGEYAGTHNQSTAYDGLTITVAQLTTGTVHVFGYEE